MFSRVFVGGSRSSPPNFDVTRIQDHMSCTGEETKTYCYEMWKSYDKFGTYERKPLAEHCCRYLKRILAMKSPPTTGAPHTSS